MATAPTTTPSASRAEDRQQESCKHHWVIEEPNGPLSRGKCKLCGSTRNFCNNPEDARLDRPGAAA